MIAEQNVRLLYWTPYFLPDVGGMETLAAKLLPRLQDLGHEIQVVTSQSHTGKPGPALADGIVINRFPFRTSIEKRDLAGFARIQRDVAALKRSFQPDIVHLHVAPDPTGYFHLSTMAAHPAPTLLTAHQVFSNFGATVEPDTLLGQLVRKSDWVTAVAGTTLDGIRALVPEVLERSSIVYSGVEDSSIDIRPLPFTPPCILYLGRLVPVKGADVLLNAFVPVVARLPDATLVIAGDGVEHAALRQQTATLGLGEHVRFVGHVEPEQVLDLLNTATLLVMPSRTEGFPITALEAMQVHRPIVATRVGGVGEAVFDGETGLLVPPEDSAELAKALLALLEDPPRAIAMGKAGALRQQQHFTLKRTAEAYDALYQRLARREEPATLAT